jgi:hypothetical protein
LLKIRGKVTWASVSPHIREKIKNHLMKANDLIGINFEGNLEIYPDFLEII